jgi:muramoyltetrapeptide carboxypeptidase
VGFFAPSGFLPDPGVIDRAARFFAARGWRVSAGDSVFARELRFAGDDGVRAADLQRLCTDRFLDAAVAARGGYGLARLLGELDYAAIARAALPIVGYSDFTAFNLAFLARAGGVSFQGPAASDFHLPDPAREASADPDGARFNQDQFFAALGSAEHTLEFAGDGLAQLHEGLEVRGRLWGGNLAIVCSLLGTPYFPRVRGGILFLEDVNEPAYRIERFMMQLLLAGVLGAQKAVLLGDFTRIPAMATDNGYDLQAAWRAVAARCPVPLIGGLPFGHGSRRATLAVGARAELSVRARSQEEGADSSVPQPARAQGAGTGAARDVTVQLRYRGHPTMRGMPGGTAQGAGS